MKNKLPKQLRFESLMKEAKKKPDYFWPKNFKRIDRRKVWKEDAQSIIL